MGLEAGNHGGDRAGGDLSQGTPLGGRLPAADCHGQPARHHPLRAALRCQGLIRAPDQGTSAGGHGDQATPPRYRAGDADAHAA